MSRSFVSMKSVRFGSKSVMSFPVFRVAMFNASTGVKRANKRTNRIKCGGMFRLR